MQLTNGQIHDKAANTHVHAQSNQQADADIFSKRFCILLSPTKLLRSVRFFFTGSEGRQVVPTPLGPDVHVRLSPFQRDLYGAALHLCQRVGPSDLHAVWHPHLGLRPARGGVQLHHGTLYCTPYYTYVVITPKIPIVTRVVRSNFEYSSYTHTTTLPENICALM